MVRNCVPIGNGQYRCYVADGVGGFVQAVSVIPGAPPVTTADIALQLETEFRRLPIAPGGIEIQPPDGWTLVNVETIVFTRAQEQVFQTAVLGVPVTVRATPTRFLWTFGDGSPPLVTRDPGAPWPDATVSHRYRTAGSRTITLSTEWAGEFRVAGGGAWLPIAGVARTNDQAPPLDVRALTNTLVTP